MRLSRWGISAFVGGFILTAISLSVPILRFAKTPPGRIFAGDQFYTDDYNAYAETIRQGIDGRWTVVDKFTSESHQPSLFRIFYLFLGKTVGVPVKFIAGGFGLDPSAVTYHLSRLLLSIALLWLVWQFIKKTLGGAPPVVWLSAWILVLFANVWPKDLSAVFSLPWDWRALFPFVREPEVTTRFFSQPHFLAGYVITFIIFIAAVTAVKNRNSAGKLSTFIFFLGFFCSWIEPTPIVLLSLTLWLYAGFVFLIFYGKSDQWQRVQAALIMAVGLSASLLPATFYYQTLRRQLPWSNNTIYEARQDFYLGIDGLLPVFGLPLLLGLSGMAISLGDKKRRVDWETTLLLISFVTAFFLFFYQLAPLVVVNRLRIFRQPMFVILDIFAALAIYRLAEKVSGLKVFSSGLRPKVIITFTIAITVITLLPGIPGTLASLRDQYLEYANFSSLAYPTTDEVAAFNWLDKNTPKSSTVAALYEAGSLIPQFSGNTTYSGNVVETINFPQKEKVLARFFSGAMSADEAYQFLKGGRVDYLYWGFQERSLGGNPLAYGLVKPVYANSGVIIFQVSLR